MQGRESRRGNSTRNQTFCLVVPTHNERENIGRLVSRLERVKDNLPFELRMVVVDDNSSDGTREILKQLSDEFPYIKVLERPALLGFGSAYLDGFTLGFKTFEPDFFGQIDADLQHPPEVLVEMCMVAITGVDVVVASRYVRDGGSNGWPLRRRIISRSANALARTCVRAPVADCTGGFRVLSAGAVRGLLESKVSTKGYAFQIVSLYAFKKLGLSFAEVPYTFEERMEGETKLNWKEMSKFALTSLKLGIVGLNIKKTE